MTFPLTLVCLVALAGCGYPVAQDYVHACQHACDPCQVLKISSHGSAGALCSCVGLCLDVSLDVDGRPVEDPERWENPNIRYAPACRGSADLSDGAVGESWTDSSSPETTEVP